MDDRVVYRNFRYRGEACQNAVRVWWGMGKIWGRTKGLLELQVLEVYPVRDSRYIDIP